MHDSGKRTGSLRRRARPQPALRIAALGLGLAMAVLVAGAAAGGSQDDLARLIAGRMKQARGIALDLGCGDAGLALALARQASGLKIQCVDPAPAVIAEARRAIVQAGLYGTRVTAAVGSFQPLNVPDRCANLVICGDEFSQGLRGRELKELYRVLSPNGIAWIGQRAEIAHAATPLTRKTLEEWLREAGIRSYEIVEEQGVWAQITRPRDAGSDEWTHRGHDAANTFGSTDTLAGPSFKPQWISDFRPGLSSAAVAIAGGRVILASLSYDEFPQATPYIQVLDAYTGTELWARVGKAELPIERRPGTYSNRESCCDIVVLGEDLYLLGGRVCHNFDLATGKLKRSLPIPREAKPKKDEVWLYLSCAGNVLYGAVGKSPQTKVDWNTMHYRGLGRAIFALEPLSGRLLWISRAPASVCSLAVGAGRLYCCDPELKLRALDAQTGKPLWTTPLPYRPGTEIAGCSYYREKVWLLYNRSGATDRKGVKLLGAELINAGHNQRELDAFSAQTGEHCFAGDLGRTVASVSFAAGMVFGTCQHSKGLAILDADSGARIAEGAMSLKCTPGLGAAHCLLSHSVRGGAPGHPEVLDLDSLRGTSDLAQARWTAFSGFRSSCSYPGIPANGMIYHQAEGCHCGSPVRGNIALVPGTVAAAAGGDRLVPGPALDEPIDEAPQPAWATWRADLLRSGQTEAVAAGPLKPLWSRKLPGRLTPLSVGGGVVYVGSTAHQVMALDASSGAPRWQQIVEGRVSVAPLLWRGRLFVSDDAGWASALRAADGQPLWRFRAALAEERMIGDGELMSRWPSRAGVLVDDGIAYFAAGVFPDEGTAVYAVDARTGALRWERQFNTHHAGSRTAGYVPAGAMALANRHLYLSSGVGNPWQIDLDDHGRDLSPLGGKSGQRVKGRDIMVVDRDLLAVVPGLQFVHHAVYKSYVEPKVAPVTAVSSPDPRLPVVTADTVYLLNQPIEGKGNYLVAGKREAYEVRRETTATFAPKKPRSGAGAQDPLRWKAWPDEPMTTLIRAAGTIFSGGSGKVYATRASDGAQLWSAAVPGLVADLAVADGRLFVQCDSGTVVCFGERR